MWLLIFFILFIYAGWRIGKSVGKSISKSLGIDSDYPDPGRSEIHIHNHTHENHLHISKEDLKDVLDKKHY